MMNRKHKPFNYKTWINSQLFLFHFAALSQVNNTFEDLINGIVSEDYELNGESAPNSVFLKSVESTVHFFLYTR